MYCSISVLRLTSFFDLLPVLYREPKTSSHYDSFSPFSLTISFTSRWTVSYTVKISSVENKRDLSDDTFNPISNIHAIYSMTLHSRIHFLLIEDHHGIDMIHHLTHTLTDYKSATLQKRHPRSNHQLFSSYSSALFN